MYTHAPLSTRSTNPANRSKDAGLPALLFSRNTTFFGPDFFLARLDEGFFVVRLACGTAQRCGIRAQAGRRDGGSAVRTYAERSRVDPLACGLDRAELAQMPVDEFGFDAGAVLAKAWSAASPTTPSRSVISSTVARSCSSAIVLRNSCSRASSIARNSATSASPGNVVRFFCSFHGLPRAQWLCYGFQGLPLRVHSDGGGNQGRPRTSVLRQTAYPPSSASRLPLAISAPKKRRRDEAADPGADRVEEGESRSRGSRGGRSR
jgi:hypothetical protein